MQTLAPIGGSLPQRFVGRKQSGMLGKAKAGIAPSFAVVGYRGKNWWLKWQGDETLLKDQQTNAPFQTLDVVIVGVNDAVSKIYYEKGYVDGATDVPECASTRGIRPDPGVPHPQSDLCATCEKGMWGSRITDNKKRAKLCSDSRRIAVVPYPDITNEACGGPMLLRVPATTLQNFSKYSDYLSNTGLDLPWVVTRLGFEPGLAYPRLTFTAVGMLDDDDLKASDLMVAHPLLEALFDTTDMNDVEPDALNERGLHVVGGGSPEPEPAPVQEPPPSTPAPEPDDGTTEAEEDEAPPPPPEAKRAPAPAATARNPFQAAAAANKPAAAPAPASAPRRPRVAAPAQASPDLQTAINELLDMPA